MPTMGLHTEAKRQRMWRLEGLWWRLTGTSGTYAGSSCFEPTRRFWDTRVGICPSTSPMLWGRPVRGSTPERGSSSIGVIIFAVEGAWLLYQLVRRTRRRGSV